MFPVVFLYASERIVVLRKGKGCGSVGREKRDGRETKTDGENFVYADAVNYILSAYLTPSVSCAQASSSHFCPAGVAQLVPKYVAQPRLRALARLVIRLQGRLRTAR